MQQAIRRAATFIDVARSVSVITYNLPHLLAYEIAQSCYFFVTERLRVFFPVSGALLRCPWLPATRPDPAAYPVTTPGGIAPIEQKAAPMSSGRWHALGPEGAMRQSDPGVSRLPSSWWSIPIYCHCASRLPPFVSVVARSEADTSSMGGEGKTWRNTHGRNRSYGYPLMPLAVSVRRPQGVVTTRIMTTVFVSLPHGYFLVRVLCMAIGCFVTFPVYAACRIFGAFTAHGVAVHTP